MVHIYVISSLLVYINAVLYFNAELTKLPTSESALLYTSVIFSCVGTGNSLVWTVAHTTLNDT